MVSGTHNALYRYHRALYTKMNPSFIYSVATLYIGVKEHDNNNINPKPSTKNMDGNIPITYVYT